MIRLVLSQHKSSIVFSHAENEFGTPHEALTAGALVLFPTAFSPQSRDFSLTCRVLSCKSARHRINAPLPPSTAIQNAQFQKLSVQQIACREPFEFQKFFLRRSVCDWKHARRIQRSQLMSAGELGFVRRFLTPERLQSICHTFDIFGNPNQRS